MPISYLFSQHTSVWIMFPWVLDPYFLEARRDQIWKWHFREEMEGGWTHMENRKEQKIEVLEVKN